MTRPRQDTSLKQAMSGFEDTAARMQALVDAILGRLTDAGIPWCLLRNRDLVPWGLLQWSDLDIMVPATVSRERLVALFSDLRPTQIVPFRHGVTYMFFPFDDMFLRVDLFHGDTGWLGAAYSDNEEILSHRWDDDGIMVAAPLHQAYLTWCNRLVRGGPLPERYQALICQQAREHPEAFRRLLERHVGAVLAGELMVLADSGRLDETPRYAWPFKRALWLTALRRHPARTILSTARHMAYGIRRRITPAGMEIVILSENREDASRLCSAFATSSYRSVPGVRAEYRQRHVPEGHLGPMSLTGELARAWRDHLLSDRGKRARMTFIFRDWHLSALMTPRDDAGYRDPRLIARWVTRIAPRPDLSIVLERPGKTSGGSWPGRSPDLAPDIPNPMQRITGDSPAMMDQVVRLIRDRAGARTGIAGWSEP